MPQVALTAEAETQAILEPTETASGCTSSEKRSLSAHNVQGKETGTRRDMERHGELDRGHRETWRGAQRLACSGPLTP